MPRFPVRRRVRRRPSFSHVDGLSEYRQPGGDDVVEGHQDTDLTIVGHVQDAVVVAVRDEESAAVRFDRVLETGWHVELGGGRLAKVVSQLRKAIGDEDAAPVIRTVHGYGYAFTAPTREDDEALSVGGAGDAVCWMFRGPREFALHDGEHLIGRASDAALCLDSPKVSRRHARVVVKGCCATLQDLGSKNGSFVRGVRITGPTMLNSGDEVVVGPFKLLFRVAPASGSTQSEAL